jgi:hypothetical protein
MEQRHRRATRMLWAMILLAVAYSVLLLSVQTLTGTNLLDGGITVLLGLYICSHPAANAVDMLFYERDAFRHLASEWNGIGWLALNMLVLLVGWVVIVIGATRLAARPT